jgi:catechol 2,3-dioxygenase-like lactoylglutathione lyase family enzyme
MEVKPMDVKLQDCFLSVDDHDKAIAFYRDALGFEVRGDVSAYGMRWVTVGPPSQPDVNIVLEPPAADPGISPSDRAAISALLAKACCGG